ADVVASGSADCSPSARSCRWVRICSLISRVCCAANLAFNCLNVGCLNGSSKDRIRLGGLTAISQPTVPRAGTLWHELFNDPSSHRSGSPYLIQRCPDSQRLLALSCPLFGGSQFPPAVALPCLRCRAFVGN